MGFFSSLFGNKKKKAETPAAVAAPKKVATQKDAAQKNISYDSELVSKLKEDHQLLFKLYATLKGVSDRGDYLAIPALLAELKLAFQTHVMLENVKFYVYLQQHLAGEEDVSSFLADVRKEMDGIARALMKFIVIYSAPGGLAPNRIELFKTELAAIGGVLAKRVELEESRLYTLYLPHY